MGTWIRHSTQYPRYQMRLFEKGQVWFTDYGHTEREVYDGKAGFLKETYPHYTCGKGLSRWIEKHNRYSSDEAKETLYQLEQGRLAWYKLFLGSSEVERRRALKDISLRLPCRPLLRWFYMYFLLGGIWDGRAGFAWCTLQAFYEYLILLKVDELKASPLPHVLPDRLMPSPEANESDIPPSFRQNGCVKTSLEGFLASERQ
jgi:hypothetical protein